MPFFLKKKEKDTLINCNDIVLKIKKIESVAKAIL